MLGDEVLDRLRLAAFTPVAHLPPGWSPNARQIRLIDVWDIPVALALDRVDQWVAVRGFSSSVLR